VLQLFPSKTNLYSQLAVKWIYSCGYEYQREMLVAAEKPWLADVVDWFAFSDSVLSDDDTDDV